MQWSIAPSKRNVKPWTASVATISYVTKLTLPVAFVAQSRWVSTVVQRTAASDLCLPVSGNAAYLCFIPAVFIPCRQRSVPSPATLRLAANMTARPPPANAVAGSPAPAPPATEAPSSEAHCIDLWSLPSDLAACARSQSGPRARKIPLPPTFHGFCRQNRTVCTA